MRIATAVSRYPFYNFRYLKLLNLVEPDVVWLFDTAIPLTPLIIKPPIILDIEDPNLTPLTKFSLIRDLYLMRNNRVKKIVTTTKILKDKLMKLYDMPEDKIEVIPYGVNLELFKPTDLPDENTILYYGTLAPHRSRFLVKVVEEVLKRRRDVKFIIIGDVPRWLQEYLTRKNYIENIVMPGYIEHDKLPEWIKKARVCIFTQDISLGGRLSFKLLEYMASGRPTVATDVDESWPIKESGAGIISPLNPEIFADNVIKLLEDKVLAVMLAEKGVKYTRQYNWSDMVARYVKLIKEMTEN